MAMAPVASAPAALNIDMSRLTNLNDIVKLLHETLAKERAIDAELDKMLMKRGDLERNILSLNASTSEVGVCALCTRIQGPLGARQPARRIRSWFSTSYGAVPAQQARPIAPASGLPASIARACRAGPGARSCRSLR